MSPSGSKGHGNPWHPSVQRRRLGKILSVSSTHLARIDCEVLVGGLRADRQTAEVFVLQPRRWDDYDIVMYRFGPDPIPGIWPKIDEQLRRLQVTTLSSYSVNHSKHANYNVQAQTRISGQESPDGPARDYYTAMKKKYLATGDKNVLVRQFCLDDPAYRELVSNELKRLTEAWVPFSPMSYYILEEPSLTCYGDAVDICFSPFTLRGMRKWLREAYGTLEKLNRQWGTAKAFAFTGLLLVLLLAVISYHYLSRQTASPRTGGSATKTEEPTPAAVKRGLLKVDSNPLGAQVFVDGSFRGPTPLQLELTQGKHEVRLTLSQYLDWEAQVEIRQGETPLLVKLRPMEETKQ